MGCYNHAGFQMTPHYRRVWTTDTTGQWDVFPVDLGVWMYTDVPCINRHPQNILHRKNPAVPDARHSKEHRV